MFDNIEIRVRGGNGGDGAVSFRHEKYVPFGGPDGGDGGNGGEVIVMADPSTASLRLFKRNRVYRAGDGGKGEGQRKHGRKGEDRVLMVPVGTMVIEKSEGEAMLIADCKEAGTKVIVARGGRGGLGNAYFASSTNQAPKIAQKGEEGEERTITLELRLIADIGIIGYPNAGKSTFLAAVSAARPKIASYPFTTLEPVLGAVEVGWKRIVLAEIPGLVEDAHLGRGLGHEFLRHVARTKILIHLVDGSSISPVADMAQVNIELGLFDAALARKPQLVAVNKIDLPSVRERLVEMEGEFKSAATPVLFISAVTGEGVPELMAEAVKALDRAAAGVEAGKQVPGRIFRPQPRGGDVGVRREGDTFVVVAPWLERIAARVDMSSPEVSGQLRKLMTAKKAGQALRQAGVKPGDKVRCGNFEWYW